MAETIFWVFRQKGDVGYITISRHARPDFVAHLTEPQIEKKWDRMKIRFPEGRFDYEDE